MTKKSQHVVPNPEGGWSVMKGGSGRATKRFDTQQEAISYGRKVSKNQGVDLYIHRRDGMVRQRDSYGNDPLPLCDNK